MVNSQFSGEPARVPEKNDYSGDFLRIEAGEGN
jgi:hypothetical protein